MTFENLANRRFGKLLVVSMDHRAKQTFWNCICDCGKMTVVRSNSLKSGNTKSCGCLFLEVNSRPRPYRRINLTGKRFGRLTAIGDCGRGRGSNMNWVCLCDCGNVTVVGAGNLTHNGPSRANTRSCGCLHRKYFFGNRKDTLKKRIEILDDVVIRGRLAKEASCGSTIFESFPDLIEAKRKQLQLHRLLKETRNEIFNCNTTKD